MSAVLFSGPGIDQLKRDSCTALLLTQMLSGLPYFPLPLAVLQGDRFWGGIFQNGGELKICHTYQPLPSLNEHSSSEWSIPIVPVSICNWKHSKLFTGRKCSEDYKKEKCFSAETCFLNWGLLPNRYDLTVRRLILLYVFHLREPTAVSLVWKCSFLLSWIGTSIKSKEKVLVVLYCSKLYLTTYRPKDFSA